jgi:hypothetical protein
MPVLSVIALDLTLAIVINYTPRVMLQIVASLTVIIYDCNVFIVHATELLKMCDKLILILLVLRY